MPAKKTTLSAIVGPKNIAPRKSTLSLSSSLITAAGPAHHTRQWRSDLSAQPIRRTSRPRLMASRFDLLVPQSPLPTLSKIAITTRKPTKITKNPSTTARTRTTSPSRKQWTTTTISFSLAAMSFQASVSAEMVEELQTAEAIRRSHRNTQDDDEPPSPQQLGRGRRTVRRSEKAADMDERDDDSSPPPPRRKARRAQRNDDEELEPYPEPDFTAHTAPTRLDKGKGKATSLFQRDNRVPTTDSPVYFPSIQRSDITPIASTSDRTGPNAASGSSTQVCSSPPAPF
ncbi:hypothetical protein C8F01DRAFT_144525 [Mycena amicta]|nr:hypothetical protein C8F01DRAFT_144525 [Mycena amicta]